MTISLLGLAACGTSSGPTARQHVPLTVAQHKPSTPAPKRTAPVKHKNPQLLLETNWEETLPTDQDAMTLSADRLVDEALAHLGVRYQYGGTSPDKGFDCSGLVVFASEKALGLKLPRRTEEIARFGQEISMNELQPGDLVFYNTLRRRYSHVGIYLGDGKFVHAPSSGGVVRVERMEVAYWKKRFNGARRLSSLLASAS